MIINELTDNVSPLDTDQLDHNLHPTIMYYYSHDNEFRPEVDDASKSQSEATGLYAESMTNIILRLTVFVRPRLDEIALTEASYHFFDTAA